MRAIVCGAGIAGLATAHQLAASGWEVIVLEKASGPREQGYMIDFFGPGHEAAEAMGLLPRLRELSHRITEVAYVDESGRRTAALNYGKFEQAVRGRLLSIMRPDLERGLREAVADQVDLRYGQRPARIDNRPDGVTVTLTDGSALDADLLVGADGIHSTVRHDIFGAEERYVRHLGFHTAAYLFTDDEVHRQVSGRFTLTDTLGCQLGCYALRDGRIAVFAVHRTDETTMPDDPRAALRREYADLGWIVPRVLEHCPDPAEIYYDTVAQIELPGWSKDRVVLVGDACQAVSLLAGQGASLAIGGAFVLAAQLRETSDIAAALTRYQQLWQPIVTEKQEVARRGAEWFLPNSRTQLRLRRLVLKISNLPGLNRLFASALAGKPTGAIRDAAGARHHQHRLVRRD